MDVINYSKKKANTFENLELDIWNTEADMYVLKYKNKAKVFKRLYHDEGPMFANKLYTLEMLNTYKECLTNSFVIPDYLVTVDKNIVGFTVPMIEGENLKIYLDKRSNDCKDQLKYLKQIGVILEDMKNIRKYSSLNDFYLNDLHAANFIIEEETKDLKVIDLDSCRIMGNKPFISKYLTPGSLCRVSKKYKISNDTKFGYIIPDENTDIYCYIMTIIEYLLGKSVNQYNIDNFYILLNHLDTLGFDKELLSIFENIILPKHNKNPYEYLDTITEEQIDKVKLLGLKR